MKTSMVFLLALFVAASANGATFLVTSTNDSGPGSLRQAIDKANAALSDDTIDILVTGTITLTSGQLVVYETSVGGALEINGPGAENLSVSGNENSRVFLFRDGSQATVYGVTISNGNGSPPATDLTGCTDYLGGGIFNGGDLTLHDVTVHNNYIDQAVDDLCIPAAGGIYSTGRLAILDSVVSDNQFPLGELGGTGGIFNNGGELTIKRSLVIGNHSYNHGGIRSRNGILTIHNSTVTENISWQEGCGGISASGTTRVSHSTVSFNGASTYGGGICAYGNFALNNSTVSSNYALYRGAISGVIQIKNSTITENWSWSDSHAALRLHSGTIGNTIVAGNTRFSDGDIEGAVVSLGHNLIGDGTGTTAFTAPGDQVGTSASPIDPMLGPLQDSGGPTQTYALLEGSPAIDAGSNALIPAGTNTDQRGFLRVVNDTVDIGAFEFGDGHPVTVDIKPGGDPNAVNPRAKGLLPVAVLTTDDFDSLRIDYTTVAFGSSGAAPARPANADDVDNDGDSDLILHFRLSETGIACGDTEATLTGETFDGQAISGTDTINTVPCR